MQEIGNPVGCSQPRYELYEQRRTEGEDNNGVLNQSMCYCNEGTHYFDFPLGDFSFPYEVDDYSLANGQAENHGHHYRKGTLFRKANLLKWAS